MSNWTSITVDNLKAAGHGQIVDSARTLAVGSVDPTAQAIAGAVARVRRAVSTGNALDQDTTRVPNSLVDVTVRIALFELMNRIGLDLSSAQTEDKRNDVSDLKRIADNRIRVEIPDTPDASAEMQSGAPVQAINVPRRQTGRERTSGL